MKKIIVLLVCLLVLTACAAPASQGGVAATTAPVFQFAEAIAEGTDVEVRQVISDSVSCLHDYSLSVRQMETMEKSDLVLLSGAGLEDFMADALRTAETVDCSEGAALLEMIHEGHSHGHDPHLWLDPGNAAIMAENICRALSAQYPEETAVFEENTAALKEKLLELKAWGTQELSKLSSRKLITFHDGFAYLASAFDLEILAAVEEEAGSEASAADLMQIIGLVEAHGLSCVFTEKNGSDAAASVIASETGCRSFTLDMAMSGDYFEAMEHNIQTLKEALS